MRLMAGRFIGRHSNQRADAASGKIGKDQQRLLRDLILPSN